jgi:hypothetical protein
MKLKDRLPRTVYRFNLPAYWHLPTPPARNAPTFAYVADDLEGVDDDLAASRELILVDLELSFTCIFSHEVDRFNTPWLFERAEDTS